MKDYYNILGIDETADKNEIKKAYHKTALKYHPDKNKNMEHLFKDAVESYEVLYDEQKRRKYDLSRKLKQDYKFVLPPEILNFSKYFFSEENINKFSDIASIINNGIQTFSTNSNFDDLFNILLDRIRNNNLLELYKEYDNYRKFYKVNTNKVYKNKKKNFSKNNINTNNINTNNINTNNINTFKNENKLMKVNIYEKNEVKKMENILNRTNNINVNIKVSLENIYNNVVKVVNLEINDKCYNCNGTGLIEKNIDNENIDNQYKNSRNKKKKNRSKKNNNKKDSFLEKIICPRCNGTMIIKKTQSFKISTNSDKICYHNNYFMNNEKGYCDINFNIIQKEHQIKRKDRYDLEIDYNISLYELYFGGSFNLNYLDNKRYKIIWEGFSIEETYVKIKNMGLSLDKEGNRGNLYINFNLILPNKISNDNMEIIKQIFNNREIKNKSYYVESTEEVKEYNVIKV
jgi:DnaJ-class molecular chaperone